ncbi:unnamed protein product, partial [Phaeothamnion confervicola]
MLRLTLSILILLWSGAAGFDLTAPADLKGKGKLGVLPFLTRLRLWEWSQKERRISRQPIYSSSVPDAPVARVADPPKISVPVWSLATTGSNGGSDTNMNIVTFATPVSLVSECLYAVSLYRHTLSHQQFCREGWGVLQLLAPAHAPLVPVFGCSSGRDSDKRGLSAAAGFPWERLGQIEAPGPIELLPGCGAYLTLRL